MASSFYSPQVVTLCREKSEPSCVSLLNLLVCMYLVFSKNICNILCATLCEQQKAVMYANMYVSTIHSHCFIAFLSDAVAATMELCSILRIQPTLFKIQVELTISCVSDLV